ncbi:hypothetical protein [Cohnella caldifontis]|uniref:hypothetical protein n=1 Tax=Cohnella caldifontis TaxID=3027471 RepID=UPI0023EADF4F|nr:hypothetical protein [Cohnella sp. YIM B05605]
MAKLVFGILMTVVWWMFHALQMDEELAMNTVFDAKHAVNRAAHAAAQQVDRDKLEIGVLSLDREQAEAAALTYLRENLRLDAELNPLPGSFLRNRVLVEQFAVLGEELAYPFTYRNEAFDYEVTLDRPGVVLIVRVAFPRLFGVLAPVEWDLKGSAEMVYD